ncbi:hypothetical protein HKX48_006316 [Thoreauomyces humboldtii]|nr:hypothetical protein HKX48_006316 [Thoreauomyces humboldtii]
MSIHHSFTVGIALILLVLTALLPASARASSVGPLWLSIPTNLTRVTSCSVPDPDPTRNRTWVVGGYSADSNGINTYHGLTALDLSTGESTDYPGLPVRSGSVCAAYGDYLMIYGGYNQVIFLSDLVLFSFSQEAFVPAPSTVVPFGPLAFATSQVLTRGDRPVWVMAGGITDVVSFVGTTVVMPIYAMDLLTWTFYSDPMITGVTGLIQSANGNTIAISNAPALIRTEGSSSVVITNDTMLVYQGWQCYLNPSISCISAGYPAQQIVIDVSNASSWTVTPVPIVGNPPYRNFMAHGRLLDDYGNALMYTCTGQNVDEHNAPSVTASISILNLTNMIWTGLPVQNTWEIPVRASALGIVRRNTFYILGGHASGGGFQDLWELLPNAGADVSRSVLSGNLLDAAGIVGQTSTLSFSVHNADASAVTYGGAQVTGTLISITPGNNLGLVGMDLGNGTYTLDITPFVSGSYALSIYFNGQIYNGASLPVTFYPATLDFSSCLVIPGGSSAGLWEESDAFQLILKDIYSNQVITADNPATFTNLTAKFESDGSSLTPVASDGILYLSYESHAAGPDQVSVKLEGQSIAGSPFSIQVVVAERLAYSDPVMAVVTALNALGVLASIGLSAWIFFDRHSNELRFASPGILGLISSSHAIMFLGNIFGGTYATSSCYARDWLLYVPANVIVSLLFAKMARIYILFIGRPMRKMKIVDNDIIMFSMVLVSIAAILLSLKSALVRFVIQRVDIGTHLESWSCETSAKYGGSSSTILTALPIVWTATLATMLLFLAYRTRNSLRKSHESKIIVGVFCFVVVSIIVWVVIEIAARNLSAVRKAQIQIWVICLDLWVSLFAIVLARLAVLRYVYHRVRGGISTGGGASTSEEVEVSVSLPGDSEPHPQSVRKPSMTDSARKTSTTNAAASKAAAQRWKLDARSIGTAAFPCSVRKAERWMWLTELQQWDVALLLINTRTQMCVITPRVFAEVSLAQAFEVHGLSGVKVIDPYTLGFTAASGSRQIRSPTVEQSAALHQALQVFIGREIVQPSASAPEY